MRGSKLLGPLIVTAVVVAVTWGSGPLARPLEAGSVAVAPGVAVTPPDGWEVAAADLVAPWQGTRLLRGPASVTVASVDGLAGSSADVLDAYARTQLPSHVDGAVAGDAGTVTLPSGRQALTLGYVGRAPDGTPVEGLLIATIRPGGGVVFDVAAPHGALVDVADDVHAIIGSAAIA